MASWCAGGEGPGGAARRGGRRTGGERRRRDGGATAAFASWCALGLGDGGDWHRGVGGRATSPGGPSAGGPRDRQRCRGARRDRGRPAIAVIKQKKRKKKERKRKTYHGPSTRTDRRMHLDWRVDRAICRSILPNLVGRHERSTTTDPETFSYSAMTAVRLRLYRLS